MKRYVMTAVCIVMAGAVLGSADEEKKEGEGAQQALIALYDTVEPAQPGDSAASLVVEGKWKKIEEGNRTHVFQGDAALVNAKLAALVKKDGSGVDLYAKGADGWNRRGRLFPAAGKEPLAIQGLTPGAVDMTEAEVQAALGDDRTITFRLGAGLPILKATPEGAVEKLRIEAPCRFAVLPDFFADDLVMDAKEIKVAGTAIPSDNFFLHMLGNDEAILAAVWEKNVRDLDVAFAGEGDERRITATDVFFGDGGSVWCALLEEEGIWHWEEMVPEDGMKGKTLTDWAVPFMAKWKGNFMSEDGAVRSLPFLGQGVSTFHGGYAHSLGRNRERRGTYLASLSPARDMQYEAYRNAYVGYKGPMVAYPIGRLEGDEKGRGDRTPLDRLCIDDLLRECLGTQACAYVLEVESRQMVNPGIFTCSYGKTPGTFVPAGPAIDKLKRTTETWKEYRAFMKAHTEGCLVFIKYIEDRINAYLDMRSELLAHLEEMEKKHPEDAEFIARLRKEMDRPAIVFKRPVSPDVRANGVEVFTPWMNEMLRALKIDTPEQAAKGMAAAKAPGIGDPQDARIRWMRRQVMVWRSMATMEMARNPSPGTIAIAQEVRKRTETTLRGGAGHEKVTVW